jgi:hypothetical protein
LLTIPRMPMGRKPRNWTDVRYSCVLMKRFANFTMFEMFKELSTVKSPYMG